jgi:hypothetical protein
MTGHPLRYNVVLHTEKSSLSFDSAVYSGFLPDVLKSAGFFLASVFVYLPFWL